MALLNFRTVALHSTRLPNSGSRAVRSRRDFNAPLTPRAQCHSICPSAAGISPGLIPKTFRALSQVSGTPTRHTPIRTASAAGEFISMAAPEVNCASEMEPLTGQVSAPARVLGRFIASLITLAGGLFGSTGQSGRGDLQTGGGREVQGEEEVGAATGLIRLGCGALVTPAGVGTTAAASSGLGWPEYLPAAQDIFAAVVTLAGALIFIQIFNELAKRDALDKKLSRKLVHIGVGLGFVLFWPLFTPSAIAPYLAAFAVAMNGVKLLLIGSGLMDDEAIVKSMTREGDRRELLRGPFYYTVAVVVTTVVFWRTSPVGIVALVNLCAGDGFADIIGRNFGTIKLPYNEYKSIAGTVGFFITSSLISVLYLGYFSAFGFLEIWPGTFLGVLLVSFFTALVESLPISTTLDDNFTVPFTAVLLGLLFLPVS